MYYFSNHVLVKCITFPMLIFVLYIWKKPWDCVKLSFFQRMSHWSAGYKLLIEISEWHALYGMFSKKLSVSRNESAEISRKISIIYR